LEVGVKDVLAFLMEHRYSLLVGVVFLEQIGLPIPTVPFLLAAGALSGMGKLDFLGALGLALFAALAADLLWYETGKRRGDSILRILCRISLEPDNCVRRTEDLFTRHGARTLLVSKFIPGLNAASTPLAGVIGMRLSRFLLFDGAGAFLWIGSYLLVGYVFANQLETVALYAARLGSGLLAILIALFVGWLAWKWNARRRLIGKLRIARIRAWELKEMLEARADLVIVDLRGALDFAADPRTIAGALRISAEDLAERHAEIPRDRDIVLFCT
jgi:membrane protein DedA with SNARE-associated domain